MRRYFLPASIALLMAAACAQQVTVHVRGGQGASNAATRFASLRTDSASVADIGRYRRYFDRPGDHSLVLTIETHDLPVVVQIVDAEENIQRLLPVVEQMMDKGLIAISDVSVMRIQKAAPARNV